MARKRRQSEIIRPSASRQSAEGVEYSAAAQVPHGTDEAPMTSKQWERLKKLIRIGDQQVSLSDVYGRYSANGGIYRWGLAVALGQAAPLSLQWLSRAGVGAELSKKRFRDVEPAAWLPDFFEVASQPPSDVAVATEAVLWAAAMPELVNHLDEVQWWNLLGLLQDYRDGLLQKDPVSPVALVGGVELGATLAWSLKALPSCRRLVESSREALRRYCEQDDLAISAVLTHPSNCRAVLASLIRIGWLLPEVSPKAKTPKKTKTSTRKIQPFEASQYSRAFDSLRNELATWVIATLRRGGGQLLTEIKGKDLRDDRGETGLLACLTEHGSESFGPAIAAALGNAKSTRRLSWKVGLAEPMLHDEDAGFACLLPEWDARRGGLAIGFHSLGFEIDLSTAKSSLIRGTAETEIRINGVAIDPIGRWETSCEYSDDDVHYLEFEQPHAQGYALQRQVMLIREDGAVLYADAITETMSGGKCKDVKSSGVSGGADLPSIEYSLRLPLGDSVEAELEQETNELYLVSRQKEALVLPLSSPEWRMAAKGATHLRKTEDGHLLLSSRGEGQLYIPMWFHLNRRQLFKKRTWRKLTVAEQLKLVPDHVAASYRVQIGSMQWFLYRSMAAEAPRTFFGKHLIADFYCARFDADDESYEDLITVEDSQN